MDMPFPDTKLQVILSFHSVTDISKFKHECDCKDFYIDRDLLTLVGTFTEEQVNLAISRYKASVQPEL